MSESLVNLLRLSRTEIQCERETDEIVGFRHPEVEALRRLGSPGQRLRLCGTRRVAVVTGSSGGDPPVALDSSQEIKVVGVW